MSYRWYVRITLYAFVALLLVLWAAGLEFTLFTGALVGLAVALASAALAQWRRSPAAQFAFSLAYLFAGFIFVERTIFLGINWFLAIVGWLVLSLIGAFAYQTLIKERRTRSLLLSARARNREQHLAFVNERRQLAQRMGLGYEERSAALAVGFGRLEQDVPDDVLKLMGKEASITQVAREARAYERMQVLLRHAAGMEAESVIHAQVAGFPATLFELEVVDPDRMADVEPQGLSKLDLAAEATKAYLSVGMVTLPFALPFVSSTYALEMDRSYEPTGGAEAALAAAQYGSAKAPQELRRQRVALTTEDEELARLLLSIPAVRRLALEPDRMPPWFVDGDRLITSNLTETGIPANLAQRWLSGLGTLAEAFPWPALDRIRTDPSASQTARHQRFFRTYALGSRPGAVLEHWEEEPTESGARLLRRTHRLVWSKR